VRWITEQVATSPLTKMIFSIEDLINEEVRKREDREITSWNASKLGYCLTGVYLERLKVKPDTEFDNRTLRVFRAGKLFEDFVTGLCQNHSGTTVELQVRAELPEYDATGYADMVVSNDKKYMYEIKSKHSYGFKYLDLEGANRQHQMQTWFYLKALGIEEGRIFYVSKDDLRVADFKVELNDEQLAKDVLNELSILNESWQKKIAPPPPLSHKDERGKEKDWRITYCRFHSKCTSQKTYLKVNY
jgi:hypothetical protein